MIKKDDLKLFWSFLYGIEDLPIPNEEDNHFSIAGKILGTLVSSEHLWKLKELQVEDTIKKRKKNKRLY